MVRLKTLVNSAVKRVRRAPLWLLVTLLLAGLVWWWWQQRDTFAGNPGDCKRCTSGNLRSQGFVCRHPTRDDRCCKTAKAAAYPQCKTKPKPKSKSGGGGGGGGGGACTESWANCTSGKPYCYWGDKEWNRGRCCTAPWSTDCMDPGSSNAAPAAPPAAPPAEKVEHWDCSKDDQPVGPVKIDWGFTEGDAAWACNQWLPGCANRCKATALTAEDYNKINSLEPGDRALVWYKNGRLHEVTMSTKGSTPHDEGFNDKKAGGIDKVWVPPGFMLCMKNRKRVDRIYPMGPGPWTSPDIEAWEVADDIWLSADGKCPKEKADALKITGSILTLGMVS